MLLADILEVVILQDRAKCALVVFFDGLDVLDEDVGHCRGKFWGRIEK